MKLDTIEKTKEMLEQILEKGLSCQEVGRPHGIGRSTVERNVKRLIALAAGGRAIEGLDRDGMNSLPRLRHCAQEVLTVVRSYGPSSAEKKLRHVTADELTAGARRVRARSSNANRDVALMYVLFCTGAKPIELARLRVRDYLNEDGAPRETSVMPSYAAVGGRERPLYFGSPRVQEVVDAYLLERYRRKLGAGQKGLFRGLEPDSGLFLTEKGAHFDLRPRRRGDTRMNCPLMVATLRATFKRAGWDGVTAQTARRQVARNLAERGARDKQLCEVLGLRSQRAARRLLNADPRQMELLARDLV